MKNTLLREMFIAAGLLFLFAVAGVALVALSEEKTRDTIAANERAVLLDQLQQVLPADRYDNDLVNDTITVTDKHHLGTDKPATIYRARKDGSPVAAILEVTAPDGYSGAIKLLVGIYVANDSISAVRVVAHKETPGLGDGIEPKKGPWIHQFDGANFSEIPQDNWKVKKDGGHFTQLTGATISPRAVVKATKRALNFFIAQKTKLFDDSEQAHAKRKQKQLRQAHE